MYKAMRLSMVASAALLALGLSGSVQAQTAADMSFFITSAGPGKGGNLGGLAGADAHCQQLAAAAGAGGKTWRLVLTVLRLCREGSSRACYHRTLPQLFLQVSPWGCVAPSHQCCAERASA